MIIQSRQQLKTYRQVVKLSTSILKTLVNALEPGLYPIEIDRLAKKLCRQHQVKPAFQGVGQPAKTYDFATCISVNDTVVHGVPSSTEKLNIGDIVKLDFGIIHQGYYTDQCVTVVLKKITPALEKLVLTAKKAVLSALFQARPGVAIGDLGQTMHSIAQSQGFDVLKQYTGHGIGRVLHEQPIIPAHGQAGTGSKLKKGMVICVEAQIVSGSDQVYVASDGWTVKMKDGAKTAMFEYMAVVDKPKPQILTQTLDWPIVV